MRGDGDGVRAAAPHVRRSRRTNSRRARVDSRCLGHGARPEPAGLRVAPAPDDRCRVASLARRGGRPRARAGASQVEVAPPQRHRAPTDVASLPRRRRRGQATWAGPVVR
jgi:hypothetical protein